MKCGYSEPWVGFCEAEVPCEEHDGKMCHVCGEKAVGGCPCASSLVCGAPLCRECSCLAHDMEAVVDNG